MTEELTRHVYARRSGLPLGTGAILRHKSEYLKKRTQRQGGAAHSIPLGKSFLFDGAFLPTEEESLTIP